MRLSFKQFIKKYDLDNFQKELKLKGQDKINFYNDLNELLKIICRIFDKITTIASLRGGLVLMSLAKMYQHETVITRTDIKNCLNIDRLEKLMHAFDYLERQNYINIERKTKTFHIIKLNDEDNPDFKLFQEIVKMFWSSPEENKERAKKWGDSK